MTGWQLSPWLEGTPEVAAQLGDVLDVIGGQLSSTVLAVHLYGSALDGGLKPQSDVDLLVTVTEEPAEATRRALLLELLNVSAPPGRLDRRPLEVTIVVRDDVVPWRFPPRRVLQFGEWLRADIKAGIVGPAMPDSDLAILITKARQHGAALLGPAAATLFDPVPFGDLARAMMDALNLWHAPPNWADDERNVVLTLARIWYTAATGRIVSKDAAADWVLERLPVMHQAVLREARAAYLGHGEDRLAGRDRALTEYVHFVKGQASGLLQAACDA